MSTERGERLRWLRLLLTGLLLIVGCYALYFLVYVRSQESYFTERNYRALATTARGVERRVEDVAHILTGAPRYTPEDVKAQAWHDSPSRCQEEEDSEANGPECLLQRTSYALLRQPIRLPGEYRDALEARARVHLRNFDEVRLAELEIQPAETLDRPRNRTHVHAELGQGRSILHVETEEDIPLHWNPSEDAVTARTVRMSAWVDLSPWLLSLDARGVFDEVLLVDGCGRLLHRSGSGLVEFGDFSTFSAKLAQGEVSATTIPVAGRRYRVYMQPVALSSAPASRTEEGAGCAAVGPDGKKVSRDPNAWQVFGFMREEKFRGESMAISGLPLIVFIFVVLMGSLSWPFLKLWLLGPNERLRRSDVRFTLLCGLAAAGLMTIFILYLSVHFSHRSSLDQQLGAVARDIDRAVGDELAEAACELMGAGHQLDRAMPLNPRDPSIFPGPEAEAEAEHSAWTGPPVVEAWGFPGFPGMSMLILIDPTGYQIGKRTRTGKATPLLRVADRAYFQEPRRMQLGYTAGGAQWNRCRMHAGMGNASGADGGALALFPEELRGRSVRAAVHVVRSRNNGKQLTVMSLPLNQDGWPASCVVEQDCKPNRVATGVVDLVSLNRVLLPPSFGFVILDRGEAPIFHSHESRSLDHRFLDETDAAGTLRRDMRERNRNLHSFRYLGRPHRALVHPMRGLPWSLVVFHDGSLIRALGLEIVLSAVSTFALFVLLFVLVQTITQLRDSPGSPPWVWPRPTAAKLYVKATLFLGLSAVFLLTCLWDGKGAENIGVLLPVPALALTALYLRFTPAGRGWRFGRWLLSWGILGVSVLIALASAWYDTTPHSSGESPYTLPAGLAMVAALAFLLWPERSERSWGARLARLRRDGPMVLWSKRGEPWNDARRSLSAADRQGYLVVAVLLLVVVGVLPAVGIFFDALSHGESSLARHQRTEVGDALVQRIAQLHHQVDGTDEDHRRGLIAHGLGMPARKPRNGDGSLPYEPRRGVYLTAAMQGVVQFRQSDPLPPVSAGGQERKAATWATWAARLRESLESLEDPFTHWIWRYIRIQSPDARWLAESENGYEHDPAVDSALPTHGLNALLTGLGHLGLDSLWFNPPESSKSALRRKIAWALLVLGFGLFAILSVLLIRSVLQRLFGLGMESFRLLPHSDTGEDGGAERHRIEFGPTPEEREAFAAAEDAVYFDCRIAPEPGDWLATLSPSRLARAARVVIDHGEACIGVPECENSLLRMLERLTARGGKPVVLLCDQDLLYLLSVRARERNDDGMLTPEDELVLGRWSALMAQFVRSYEPVPLTIEGLADAPKEKLRILKDECAWDPGLHRVAHEISRLPKFEKLSEEQIAMQVLNRAGPRLHYLWSLCTTAERLELCHLADDGLVNPHSWTLARRLERRGLLKRDPAYRLASRSLQRFVLDVVAPGELARWERTGAQSTWQSIRAPLLLAIVLGGGFLFATQQQLFDATVGAVAGASASLPVMIRLLSLVRGKSTQSVA